MRHFHQDEGRSNHPENSLLLCALAHEFPDKSNCDLQELLTRHLKTEQSLQLRNVKTGPGYNTDLFKYAAKLANVEEIQVLVVQTKTIFKFRLDSYKTNKVMQIQCESDTVMNPSYSLQINAAEFVLFKCPFCESEFPAKDDKHAHVGIEDC